MSIESVEKQRKLDEFVSKEVFVCQSSLVDELLQKEILSYDEISNLYAYCVESLDGLSTEMTEDELQRYKEEIEGYLEEAEEKENKKINVGGDFFTVDQVEEHLEELEGLDSEPQEIFEWWIISNWFADKLEEAGEPILRSDYGTWWGRTCTGQAIILDYVIEKIYDSLK